MQADCAAPKVIAYVVGSIAGRYGRMGGGTAGCLPVVSSPSPSPRRAARQDLRNGSSSGAARVRTVPPRELRRLQVLELPVARADSQTGLGDRRVFGVRTLLSTTRPLTQGCETVSLRKTSQTAKAQVAAVCLDGTAWIKNHAQL